MSHIDTIREAVRQAGRADRDDQETADVLAALMRDHRGKLAGMHRREFTREVRGALAALDAAPGFARWYCQTVGLVVPGWAEAEREFDVAAARWAASSFDPYAAFRAVLS